MIHRLKTDHDHFRDVIAGFKLCEIRYDDRHYQQWDTLVLQETKYTGEEMEAGRPLEYTGREVKGLVSHIIHGPAFGIRDGWVAMSLQVTKKKHMTDC